MLNLYPRVLHLCVILSSLFFVGCSPGQKDIVSANTEKEANEILVLLSTKGITGTKQFVSSDQGGSWSISVPGTSESEAINIVTLYGYPKGEQIDIVKAFSGNSLMKSPQDDQAKYQRILELQLSHTLKQFDGILDAEVNISVHQNININEMQMKSDKNNFPLKASVYIKHTGIINEPGSQHIPKIKKLVSSRIIGLDPENVYVVTELAHDIKNQAYLGSVSLSRELKKEQSVLGIKINTNSVKHFRILILISSIILLIITLALIFFIWKIIPAIRQNWRTLLSFKQIKPSEKDSEKDENTSANTDKKPDDTSQSDQTNQTKQTKPEVTKKSDKKDKKEAEIDKKQDDESKGIDNLNDSALGI